MATKEHTVKKGLGKSCHGCAHFSTLVNMQGLEEEFSTESGRREYIDKWISSFPQGCSRFMAVFLKNGIPREIDNCHTRRPENRRALDKAYQEWVKYKYEICEICNEEFPYSELLHVHFQTTKGCIWKLWCKDCYQKLQRSWGFEE
jgi:hypothetical protein